MQSDCQKKKTKYSREHQFLGFPLRRALAPLSSINYRKATSELQLEPQINTPCHRSRLPHSPVRERIPCHTKEHIEWKQISVDQTVILFLVCLLLHGFLLLPLVVGLVEILLPGRLCLQALTALLLVFNKFLINLVILVHKAVIVIVERRRKTFLHNQDLFVQSCLLS